MPAIWARLARTTIPATATPQPPSQPTHGPNAFVPQVNVVPQSGISLLSSRYANAMNSIGMNARMKTTGACAPTARTTKPSVATSEQTGAVEASPMTVEPHNPRVPAASPLPSGRSRVIGVVATQRTYGGGIGRSRARGQCDARCAPSSPQEPGAGAARQAVRRQAALTGQHAELGP